MTISVMQTLSDFFYVWMRKALRSVYPDVFADDARNEQT